MMKDEGADQKCHPLSTANRSAMGFPLFNGPSGGNVVGIWQRFVVAVASGVMVGILGVFQVCQFGVFRMHLFRKHYASRLREGRLVAAIASGLTIVATVADNRGIKLAINGGNGGNSLTMVGEFCSCIWI